MDYTLSNSYDTHPGTGNRMHEDAKAVPTVWSAKDANSIIWSLMELAAAAGQAGVQFDKANPASYRVLLNALRSNQIVMGSDIGAANACVVNYTPAISQLLDGMVLWFKAKASNTGATTLNVNGLGAKPIYGAADHLQGGEIIADCHYQVQYYALADGFVLVSQNAGALQVEAASNSWHALPLGQAIGRLIAIQTLSASGTYVRSPGATAGWLRGIGGGAGGSGSAATAAGQVSIAPGGQSGAWGEHWFAHGLLPASQAFAIGAAGAAGAAGGAGGAGGTTQFGSLLFPGGLSTPVAATGTPPVLIGPNASASQASGCNIFNGRSAVGGYGIAVGAGGFVSGAGAASPWGGGAYPNVTGGAAGQSASSRGSGGGGASAGASSAAFAGGAGAPGQIVIFEFGSAA